MDTPTGAAVPLNALSRDEVYKLPPLTVEQVLALPAAFGLEYAARAWGMGETFAMRGAKEGTLPFPAIKLGARGYTVRRSDLLASLGITEDARSSAAAAPDAAGAADPAA